MEATNCIPRFAKRGIFLAIGCGVVTFVVYLLTLAPELSSSPWSTDSGDLISAAYLGRLSHPPGAPLYWLLTRLFIKLPFGNPAWRLNLFSSLNAALTVGVLVAALKVQQFNDWIATISGLSVGFSKLFWSHAIIAEVYTSAALCVVAFLLVQATGQRYHREYAFWSGVVTGLAGSVHLTTLALCIPGWPKQNHERVLYILGLLLGLSPYLVFLLVQPCTQIWGDICSLNGWWAYVSAQMYGGYSFALPRTQWLSRLLALLSTYSRMFTPLGAIVMIFGMGRLVHANKHNLAGNIQSRYVVRYLIALLCVSVYALLYNTGDSVVYLVPMLPVCGYLLAVSYKNIKLPKVPVQAFAIIPLLLITLNWSMVSLADDTKIAQQQELILAQLPERALMLTQQGEYTFDMWYSVEVLGRGRDVVIVDTALWQYAPYRAYMQANYTEVSVGDDPGMTTRPVCKINLDKVLCD